MYYDTVGAWITVTRAFQLLCVYCRLPVTFGMSDFEILNVKLSETDIIFLLILNVFDWNKSHYLYVGWCVISFHVCYTMFFSN